jgi:hypothetical protein
MDRNESYPLRRHHIRDIVLIASGFLLLVILIFPSQLVSFLQQTVIQQSLPPYPNAIASTTRIESNIRITTFQTTDPPEAVFQFYERALHQRWWSGTWVESDQHTRTYILERTNAQGFDDAYETTIRVQPFQDATMVEITERHIVGMIDRFPGLNP